MGVIVVIAIIIVVILVIVSKEKDKEVDFSEIGNAILYVILILLVIGFGLFQIATFM